MTKRSARENPDRPGNDRLREAWRAWFRPAETPGPAEQTPDAAWALAVEQRLSQVERRLKAIQSLVLLVLVSSAREVLVRAAQHLPDLWN